MYKGTTVRYRQQGLAEKGTWCQAVGSTDLIVPTLRTWIAYGHSTHEMPPRPTYPTNPIVP